MDGNQLYLSIENKLSKIFTLLIRRSFKGFGRRSIISFPNRFDNAKSISVGDDVIIYKNCWIMAVDRWYGQTYNGTIHIADNAVISQGVQMSAADSISIGKNTGIGKNCVVVDHLHDYSIIDRPIMSSPLTRPSAIVIEEDVFVGVNCVIGPGAHIGKHAFIGGNSVVSGTIPPFCVAVGNPARVIRRYNRTRMKWDRVAP